MEFKNVFIINSDEGVIPYINSIPENLEEERKFDAFVLKNSGLLVKSQ